MSEKRRHTYTNGQTTTVLVEYEDREGITIQQWPSVGAPSQVVALLHEEWEDMVTSYVSAPPISQPEYEQVGWHHPDPDFEDDHAPRQIITTPCHKCVPLYVRTSS